LILWCDVKLWMPWIKKLTALSLNQIPCKWQVTLKVSKIHPFTSCSNEHIFLYHLFVIVTEIYYIIFFRIYTLQV
jgi:hypothetical protein